MQARELAEPSTQFFRSLVSLETSKDLVWPALVMNGAVDYAKYTYHDRLFLMMWLKYDPGVGEQRVR